jgi:hypothetical protein
VGYKSDSINAQESRVVVCVVVCMVSERECVEAEVCVSFIVWS